VAELEETNAQLRTELNAAQSNLLEVECREWAVTSYYEELKDFDEMCSSHPAVVKEKADLEKLAVQQTCRASS
jgi:hypothetical protein